MNAAEERIFKIVAKEKRTRTIDISRKYKKDCSNVNLLLNRLLAQGFLKKEKLGMSVYYSLEDGNGI